MESTGAEASSTWSRSKGNGQALQKCKIPRACQPWKISGLRCVERDDERLREGPCRDASRRPWRLPLAHRHQRLPSHSSSDRHPVRDVSMPAARKVPRHMKKSRETKSQATSSSPPKDAPVFHPPVSLPTGLVHEIVEHVFGVFLGDLDFDPSTAEYWDVGLACLHISRSFRACTTRILERYWGDEFDVRPKS